jgi:hypothetical protein
MLYGFQDTIILLPWLSLLQTILFYSRLLLMTFFFKILFLIVFNKYIKVQLILYDYFMSYNFTEFAYSSSFYGVTGDFHI